MLVSSMYANGINDLVIDMPHNVNTTLLMILESNEDVKRRFIEKIDEAVRDVLSCEDVHSTGNNLLFCLPSEMVDEMVKIQTATGVPMNTMVLEALRCRFNLPGTGIITSTSKKDRVADAITQYEQNNAMVTTALGPDAVAAILKNQPSEDIEIDSVVIPSE